MCTRLVAGANLNKNTMHVCRLPAQPQTHLVYIYIYIYIYMIYIYIYIHIPILGHVYLGICVCIYPPHLIAFEVDVSGQRKNASSKAW